MAMSMHRVAVGSFEQTLPALSATLRKGDEFAQARNIDPAAMLAMRIFPNMYGLAQQVWAAARQAIWTCPMLLGEDLPELEPIPDSFDGACALLDRTLAYVRSFEAAAIDATADREVTIPLPHGELKMPGENYLLKFALPNFWFHATAAYTILRQCGVELNKGDFLGRLP